MVDRFRVAVASLVLAVGSMQGCGPPPVAPVAETCPEVAAWLPAPAPGS